MVYTEEYTHAKTKVNFYMIFWAKMNFSVHSVSERSRLEPRRKSQMKTCRISFLQGLKVLN